MTQVREEVFTIDLPGTWEKVATQEPGSVAYRQTDGPATLVVLLLHVRPLFAIADKARLLDDFVHHRSNYERGRSPGLVNEAPESGPVGESFEASWSASDQSAATRRRHRVVLLNELLADFCYEAPVEDAPAFDRDASALLSAAILTVQDAG